jgi:hypothetical protein
MKRIILLIVLVASSCKGAFSQVSPDTIFQKKLLVIEESFNGKPMDGKKLIDAVNFLQNLTGIKSDIDREYDAIISPSEKNLEDWRAWYNKNRKDLYWDEKEQMVKCRCNP